MIITLWHLAVHVMGADGGAPPGSKGYGRFNFYYFDSGFGNGSLWITFILVLIPVWYHHKCHVRHCWRWGRFLVAGGQYRVCHHHHPDLAGGAPTAEYIAKVHAEWQEREHRKGYK